MVGDCIDDTSLTAIIRQATALLGEGAFVLSPEAEAVLVAKTQLYLAKSRAHCGKEELAPPQQQVVSQSQTQEKC